MDQFLGGLIPVVRSTEFWSAMAGAFVAGAISYILFALQLKAGKAEREENRLLSKAEREEERKAVHEALSRSLLTRMIRVHSNYRTLQSHLAEFNRVYAKRNPLKEPFRYRKSLVSYPAAEHFSPEEMASLMRLVNIDLFNAMLEEGQQFNALVDGLRELDRLMNDLSILIGAGSFEGATTSSSVHLNDGQKMTFQELELTVHALSSLLNTKTLMRYMESGRNLRDLHRVLEREHGWNISLAFLFDKHEWVSLKGSPPISSEATGASPGSQPAL